MQFRVASAIDVAHSARTEWRNDLVGSEQRA
jgi:hypothetical protein